MRAPTPSDTFESLVPRQDAAARLLLLLAKDELSEPQRTEARALAAQVDDWPRFAAIAARKFVVTYAHRHLQACANDLVPPHVMAEIRSLARASALASLRIVGAQVAFHNKCISPNKARHAYMKGAMLVRQYGRNIGDRYGRDVDVLVAESDFKNVLKSAVSSGYRILHDGAIMPHSDWSRDLEFLSAFADVVAVIGPEDVPIEIHRRLDKLSLNFDLEEIFAAAEPIELGGATLNTLSKPYHFVYIAYHHSRHFWSHLHWLADLDAMIASPASDRGQIEVLADSIGIMPTVAAAFEFHTLVSQPGLWGACVPAQTGGGQFLKACLLNLDGDLEFEQHLRLGMTLNDFMSAWQISPGRHNTFWINSWSRRLRPSVTQYFDHKYPASLYWLYTLQNALGLAKNAVILCMRGLARLPRSIAQRLALPSAGPTNRKNS